MEITPAYAQCTGMDPDVVEPIYARYMYMWVRSLLDGEKTSIEFILCFKRF